MKSAPKGKSSDKKTSAKNTKSKPIRLKTPRTHKPDHLELDEWQRTLRKEYGEQQEYKLRNAGNHPIFSDFSLTNPASEKIYNITIRSDRHFDNYCSCPDYRISNLGTCKHIEFTLSELMKKRGAKKAFKEGYIPPYSEICLNYGLKRDVKFRTGEGAPDKLLSLVDEFFDANRNLKSEQFYLSEDSYPVDEPTVNLDLNGDGDKIDMGVDTGVILIKKNPPGLDLVETIYNY